jgi:hypothetical protein
MAYSKHRCSMRSIPQSPLSLIQELYTDPWQHLTCCLLCTRTTGGETIRGAITTFLHLYPSPSAVLDEPREVLLEVIHPLGLQDMRLKAILAMSTDFLAKVGVFVKRDQHPRTDMHSLARLHILLLGWPEHTAPCMHWVQAHLDASIVLKVGVWIKQYCFPILCRIGKPPMSFMGVGNSWRIAGASFAGVRGTPAASRMSI